MVGHVGPVVVVVEEGHETRLGRRLKAAGVGVVAMVVHDVDDVA